MLTEWRDASAEPELKAGTGRFLVAISDTEAATLVVLGVLAAALGAPWEGQ